MSLRENEKERCISRLAVSPSDSNKKIGHIRTHLMGYIMAKSEEAKGKQSTIIFRVDDSNKANQSKEKIGEIYRFFSETLGLEFDVTPHNSYETIGQSVFQSERQDMYRTYLEELFDRGVAFLDAGSGLALFDIEAFINQYSDEIVVHDLLFGKLRRKLEEKLRSGQNYFPLMRSDGSALYNLASVVDDATFGVTHITRGNNKIPVVEVQEMIRQSLGLEPVTYLHTPILLDQAEGVLKAGPYSYDDFIDQGIIREALISYLITSGYGDANEIYPSLENAIKEFDSKKVHKNNSKFDPLKLHYMNRRLIRKVSDSDYLKTFKYFLKRNKELTVMELLERDKELRNFVLRNRRNPNEVLALIKAITNTLYEPIREDTRVAAGKIITELQEKDGVLPTAESIGLSKQIFFDSLRWILVGKYSFPDVVGVYNYLRFSHTLGKRLVQSLNELENQNKRNIQEEAEIGIPHLST